MAYTRWMSLLLALAVAAATAAGQSANTAAPCFASPSSSSQPAAASRLAGDWRASGPVTLPAGKLPVLRDAADLGLAPGGTRLDRVILLLQPSAAQSSALEAELHAQQTPGSCAYHQWLTPQQFAQAYANSAADVNAIADWLRTEGFTVAPLPASRGWIEFSGTAAQVTQAFGGPIHAYATASGTRFALRGAISAPAAFSALIHGLVSLDGSAASAALTPPQPVVATPAALAVERDPSRAEALTPQLAAQLMHFDSLGQGAGESIAIAARSNVRPTDIAAFRSTFGLPADPVVVSPAGSDPGLTTDQAAAELAASWAGAAAPASRIIVAPAGSTSATDGVDLSLAAIIDQSLAHTVLVGYSSCEASLSEPHQAFYAALYRQAAAQGMSVISATGDSGGAACHAAGSDGPVTSGYAVNALAATPWNTAVGAAAFTSSDDSTLAAWSPVHAAEPAYATGGGRSIAYPAPAWQSGLSGGAPARVLPDVALPTALDSAFSRGLAFCFSASQSSASPSSGCNLVRSGGSAAAAAIFAGVSAVIAQQNGAQGNLTPRLYALRTRAGIYTDIESGSARLACVSGSSGCDAAGTLGYDASAGYDMASGLGSPNARNLVDAWPDVGSGATTVTLSVSPTQSNATYNPSSTVTFTVKVASGTGGATPTGSVDFFDQFTNSNLNSAPYALDSSGTASITLTGAMPQGGNPIVAKYSGDTTYAAQNSQTLTVNIQPSTTTTTVTPATTSPKVNTAFNVTAQLTVGSPPAGTVSPTGNMTLTVDGATYKTAAVSTSAGVTSATFSVTLATNGAHNLQAIYAGDGNYTTSTSNSVPVTASTNSAAVALTVSPTQSNNTYNPSAAITFSAAVTSQTGGATPTGTVNFLDQATGNNINASPVTLDSNGKASVTETAALPQGGNSVVAQYNGDATYAASNSQVLTVNIQPSTTTSTVAPSTTTPTAGTAFPVNVTVAPGTPPAGTVAPTGKVTLTLDGTAYASANVSTTTGTTSASFNVTIPSGGQHNLQAMYAGDANYSASTSATVSVTVAKGTTVTTLTATPPTLTAGTPETLTATIAAASPVAGVTYTFTGTVTFYDGTSQIGTATVSSNTATLSNVTLSTTTTHSITAVYSGDDTWTGSTSNIVTLKPVLIPVTVTLAVTPTAAAPGQVVTLLATVTPSTAPASSIEQNPTGNIIFYNGTTILGTVALSAAANNTSTAQLLFTTLPAGQDTLTAVYVGDLYYAAATSNAVTITVQDFTLTPGPDNPPSDLDIVKGTSGQVSYVVTGLGGFNSQIALACAVPEQDDMTCSPNPIAVTPTGTVTFTVTTYTTGTTSASARRNRAPLGRAGGAMALAVLVFFLLPAGRRVRVFAGRRLLILILLLGAIGASGIGCSSVAGSVQGGQGTPLGETTLTITGAANVDNTVFSHSVYLTVNVLPATGGTGTVQPGKGAK